VACGHNFQSALHWSYSEPLTVLPSILQRVIRGSVSVIPLFYDATATPDVIKHQIRLEDLQIISDFLKISGNILQVGKTG
jgi:hypothetical protein